MTSLRAHVRERCAARALRLAGRAQWQQLWLVRQDGSDEEILEPFGDDGYRIGTPAEISGSGS